MFDVGRLCMKIAGRDAGRYCLIVEVLDKDYVLIDGQTRRRKCNVDHLEPMDKMAKIKDKADNKIVVKALQELDIECAEKQATKTSSKKPRPKKQKVKKADLAPVEEKPKKVAPKKEEKPAPVKEVAPKVEKKAEPVKEEVKVEPVKEKPKAEPKKEEAKVEKKPEEKPKQDA